MKRLDRPCLYGTLIVIALFIAGSIMGQQQNSGGTISTVTANAGTNLNTSALALEAGGNLALIKAKTDNIDVALSTRLKPADTLAGVTTVAAVTSITNAINVIPKTSCGNTLAAGSTLAAVPVPPEGTCQCPRENHNDVGPGSVCNVCNKRLAADDTLVADKPMYCASCGAEREVKFRSSGGTAYRNCAACGAIAISQTGKSEYPTTATMKQSVEQIKARFNAADRMNCRDILDLFEVIEALHTAYTGAAHRRDAGPTIDFVIKDIDKYTSASLGILRAAIILEMERRRA